MFDHFTFGAPAQTLYPEREDREASPTDCSEPSPLSDTKPTDWEEAATPLDGLLNQFAQSTIRPDDHDPMWCASWQNSIALDENEMMENEEPQQSLWNDTHLSSPDFDHSEFSIEELSYVSTRKGMATIPLQQTLSAGNTNPFMENPRHGAVSCKRLRRQMDAKMMGCEKHVRDISTLVEDMIESNSQCNLRNSTSTSTSPTTLSPSLPIPPPFAGVELVVDTTEPFPSVPDDDEGFGEMDEDPLALDFEQERLLEIGGKDDEMTLRRASTPSGIRKYTVIKYRKSADVAAGGVTSNGRPKIRSVPRMRRRRKVASVVE